MLLCPEYRFSKKTASGRQKRKKAVSKELFWKQSIKKGKESAKMHPSEISIENSSEKHPHFCGRGKAFIFFKTKKKYLGYTKSIQSLQLSDKLRGILMPNVIKNQAQFKSVLWVSYDWTTPSTYKNMFSIFALLKFY